MKFFSSSLIAFAITCLSIAQADSNYIPHRDSSLSSDFKLPKSNYQPHQYDTSHLVNSNVKEEEGNEEEYRYPSSHYQNGLVSHDSHPGVTEADSAEEDYRRPYSSTSGYVHVKGAVPKADFEQSVKADASKSEEFESYVPKGAVNLVHSNLGGSEGGGPKEHDDKSTAPTSKTDTSTFNNFATTGPIDIPHFLDMEDWIQAIIFIVCGFGLCYFGAVVFPVALFLGGAFAGTLLGVFIIGFILSGNPQAFGTEYSKIIQFAIIGAIAILCGLIVGIVSTLGAAVFGAGCFFVVAECILLLLPSTWLVDSVYRKVFFAAFIISGIVAGIFLKEIVIRVGTSIIGAFAFVVGVDYYVGTGLREYVVAVIEGSQTWNGATTGVYVLLGVYALMVSTGIVIQQKFFNPERHYTKLNEPHAHA